MSTYRFLITGRVQGVGYRSFVYQTARKLHLDGYVRNLPDGSVECAASGPGEKLEALLRHLHEGPPMSRVEEVHHQEIPTTYSGGFEVRF